MTSFKSEFHPDNAIHDCGPTVIFMQKYLLDLNMYVYKVYDVKDM